MNERLDQIATDYHNAALSDMHIEEECQLYESTWISAHITNLSFRVLDLGYGDGVNFEAIARQCRLTLVEGSLELCAKAQKRSDSLKLDVEIVHSLFENFDTNQQFDLILVSHVLEHVDDPVGLLRHLQNFLKRDGKLVGIVPNSESFHRKLGVAMGLQQNLDDLSERDHLVGHQRVYCLGTLRRDIETSGMELIEHRGFFLKVLANSQMVHLDRNVLLGLLKISEELPTEFCANIGFVATVSSTSRTRNKVTAFNG